MGNTREEQIMEKYSDELNNIELFRYLYEDFPPGKLIRTESPDFIIKDGPRNSLGIEITHVMDENHAERLSSDSAENRVKKLIVSLARESFEDCSDRKLNVALYFRPGRVPKKERIIHVAGIISNAVLSRVEGRKTGESYHIHFTISELDEFLESVTIFRFPEITEADWIDAGAYTLPGLEAERIEKTITHKKEKLRIYQKKHLRYYWLLLIMDTALHHDGMPEIMNLMDMSGAGFNKVFLIERRVGRLYELS
ncbi:MAG TPA: hypothetical protein VE870_09340 [Bacteroidales bacterium]|nr:hypothetical protein [Bacteroidales bacterium]